MEIQLMNLERMLPWPQFLKKKKEWTLRVAKYGVPYSEFGLCVQGRKFNLTQ